MKITFDKKEREDKKEILSNIDELSIYRIIVPEANLEYKCLCPFHNERTPSFSLYQKGLHGIRYKCFGCGEGGDVVDFIMNTKKLDFIEALQFIKEKGNGMDNSNGNIGNNYSLALEEKREGLGKSLKIGGNLEVTTQAYTETDLHYWGAFGINLNDLINEDIFSVQKATFPGKKGSFEYVYSKEDPCYWYKYGRGYNKFYFPNRGKGKRFLSYGEGKDIIEGLKSDGKFGYHALLIICKSKKDAIILRKLGYNTVAFSSENTLPRSEVIDDLKTHCQEIYIYFDNDAAGIKGAQKASRKYRLGYIHHSNEIKEKDAGDYFKSYGGEKLKELIDNLLKYETQYET